MQKALRFYIFITLLLSFYVGIAAGQIILDEPYAFLGEGYITRKIAYSHDEEWLAVASNRGVWLFDADTLTKVALLEERLGWVGDIAFSPDGQLLASGVPDGTIKLWSLASRQVVAVLKGHEKPVWSVAFSPNGKMLASGSEDKTVKLWQIDQEREIATFTEHNRTVTSVAFSPDGQMLASGSSDSSIRLWDVRTGEKIDVLAGHYKSLSFNPDSKILVFGDRKYGIRMWDIEKEELIITLTGHTETVYSLEYSPGGQVLASGSYDGTVRLWNMTTRQQAALLEHTGRVVSVAFSPDGKTLATASDGDQLQLWNLATRQKEAAATLAGHASGVESIAFSPDGETLASGSYVDGTVRLWDMATKQEIAVLAGDKPVRYVAYSPDGKILAVASDILGKNSSYLVNTMGDTQLWDTQTLKIIASLEHSGMVFSINFSPDSRILATAWGAYDNVNDASSGGICLWDVRTQNLINTLGHDEIVYSAAFSPDGKMIAAGELENMRLWDVATGQLITSIRTGDTARCMEFSPDGQTLALGLDLSGGPFLWEAPNGEEIQRLRAPDRHLYPVRSLSFSPSSQIFASMHFGTIRLWNVMTRETEAILNAPRVSTVRFSPDGKTLASGTGGGTILLWDTSSFTSIDPVTGIEPGGKITSAWGAVKKAELLQNYPNPFNPDTWIPYKLGSEAEVSINIYNSSGILIRTIPLERKSEGIYTLKSEAAYWDGRDDQDQSVASGIYFYQLVTGETNCATRKMTIIR